jgi:hypothetical protein
MRLITLDQDGELSLITPPYNNIPEYAILSHTWIDGQEVTYKDLTKGRNKDKSGFKKIPFCVDQAARHGLRYSSNPFAPSLHQVILDT